MRGRTPKLLPPPLALQSGAVEIEEEDREKVAPVLRLYAQGRPYGGSRCRGLGRMPGGDNPAPSRPRGQNCIPHYGS